MATVQGAAAYKKKDGLIAISNDQTAVIWTPAAPGAPAVSIRVVDITSTTLLFHYFGYIA